jgi:hypothetical protein
MIPNCPNKTSTLKVYPIFMGRSWFLMMEKLKKNEKIRTGGISRQNKQINPQ